MKDKIEILKEVQEVYNSFYSCANEILKFETNIKKDLSLDSIDILEFVMLVEDRFDLSISNEDMESVETIKDVVDVIIRDCEKRECR